jgi:DNA-binding ferritin-like protein (Dps family)
MNEPQHLPPGWSEPSNSWYSQGRRRNAEWRRYQHETYDLWVDFHNDAIALEKWVWYSSKTEQWQVLENVNNVEEALKLAEVLHRMA